MRQGVGGGCASANPLSIFFSYFCLIYVIIFEAYANFLLLLSFQTQPKSCMRVAYLFSLCVCEGV